MSACFLFRKRCFYIFFLQFLSFFTKAQEPVFKQYQRVNGLKSEYINYIFQDSKGFIWISSDKGLSRFDGKNIFHLNTDNGLPANMVYDIWEDNEKIFFKIYEKGSFSWNGEKIEKVEGINPPKKFQKITYIKNIKQIPIYRHLHHSLQDASYLNTLAACYLKDYENNEWVAVFGKGLFRYIPYLEHYPIEDEIVNFWQDEAKNFYFFGKKGVYIGKNYQNLQFLPLKDVRAIDYFEGKFYLASLYNYYPQISYEQLFYVNKLPAMHCTGFSDMLHTQQTRWISTFGHGVLRFEKGKADTISTRNGLVSNNIERLQKTASALWASTYGNGVSRIDLNGKITNLNQKNGLLSDIVYYVFEDSLQNNWVATEKGISVFDKNLQKKYDIGFPEKVLAIGCFQGRYWAVSEKYLYEIIGQKLCKWAGVYLFTPDTKNVINRVFFINEKIYIATLQGLFVLNLEKIQKINQVKPKLQIIEIKMKDTAILAKKFPQNIRINWQKNYLRIHLATLSFQNENENTICYRIREVDTQWTEPKPIREIVWADFQYKTHTLEIQMLNANKKASEVQVLRIEVQAPFWHTWWFRGLAALLILGTFALLIRYLSFRKLKSQLKALELQQKIQQERERIARDLHDNVGSRLAYIIADLEHTSKNLALAQKQKLDEIADFARQTINQLRETIWAMHQQSISAENLEIKVRDLIWRYTKNFSHIKIKTNIDFTEDFSLNAIQALNIYRILQEILNNAFQHSQATQIEVDMQSKNWILNLRVRDNGRGFEPENLEQNGHYGITNIRKRAEEIEAHLLIRSQVHQGTWIQIQVPNLHKNSQAMMMKQSK
jgi:signal transduction histidine kinase